MGYTIQTNGEVEKFISALDVARRTRIDRYYDLFEIYGQSLPARYLKKVSTHVWELRPGDIRLFLTIKGNAGYVIHAIKKKTQKTPKKDLDLAIQRSKEEVNI